MQLSGITEPHILLFQKPTTKYTPVSSVLSWKLVFCLKCFFLTCLKYTFKISKYFKNSIRERVDFIIWAYMQLYVALLLHISRHIYAVCSRIVIITHKLLSRLQTTENQIKTRKTSRKVRCDCAYFILAYNVQNELAAYYCSGYQLK